MTEVASYAIQRISDGFWYVGTADKKPIFMPAPTKPALFTGKQAMVRHQGLLDEDHDVEVVPIAVDGIVHP
jgi:hypothetical protein